MALGGMELCWLLAAIPLIRVPEYGTLRESVVIVRERSSDPRVV